MKKVAIIQARTTSTRLPGKILMDLAGRPMLAQQLGRLRQCRMLDELVIATTTNATDDPVANLARLERIGCFRGSEEDVLSRYVGAAREASADVVIRLTADCPLIDAEVVDLVVSELVLHTESCDYAGNVLERTYPRGLDVEAFSLWALEECDRYAKSASLREHVTLVIRQEKPELFRRRSVVDTEDNSDLRWTVDTQTDLDLVRAIYKGLDLPRTRRTYRDIVSFVRSHPELMAMNNGIETWDPMRQQKDTHL
ncbi:MAG: glycosyltransferase family protein [candidate division Zixibacteria bacterium]|nr:glycosyltransferase family protein [candidate division Zixibacteria bacterium]